MTRFYNHYVTSKVQVLDADGNPATAATVYFRLYDWGGNLVDDGTMEHVADGIYKHMWYAGSSGHWVFEAYCSNPKFRTAKNYFVHRYLTGVMGPFSGVLELPEDTGEHELVEIDYDSWNEPFECTVQMDFSYSGNGKIIRTYSKVDGADYRLESVAAWPVNFDAYIVNVKSALTMQDWRLTVQNADAEETIVPYSGLTNVWGQGDKSTHEEED